MEQNCYQSKYTPIVNLIVRCNKIKEKRLRIDIAVLREMFERKIITIIHNISTKTQQANALTKGVSTKKLLDLL